MITITDVATSITATVDRDEVAQTVAAWYPAAPSEITTAIQDLEAALQRDAGITQEARDLAGFLGLALS